ncbi:hypothetical protein WJX75_002070 [Coccomyxa subellipsoidea]|uniref:Uncharacterized protein n=1 Tax=Coccomyxa subellipsoidea TaxID=248742 RepID=A0ABR2YZ99_9CHLO
MARVVAFSRALDIARLARAKGYPYARPSSSFLYVSGSAYLFEDAAWRGIEQLGSLHITSPDGTQGRAENVLEKLGVEWSPNDPRTPVLAVGSNAGPEQLLRKYPPVLFRDGVMIPCVRCILADFDVAYSPCITSYGSCSATLEYSPGTAVEIFVTFLTAPQLKRMHETEGAYFLTELRQVQLHLGLSLEAFREGKEGAALLHTVYQYNHQSGTLHLPLGSEAATPVAIREIRAEGRKFPALDQIEMQEAVRSFLINLEQESTHATTNGAEFLNGRAASQTALSKPAENSHGGIISSETESCPPLDNQGVMLALDGPKQGSLEQSGSKESKGEEGVIDAWILQNLDDVKARTQRVELLVAAAKPQQYQHVTVLMAIGDIYDKSVE